MKLSALGRQGLTRNAVVVEKMWEEIESVVANLPVTPATVRVYQDGLPVCGHEQEIVSELAGAGNRNHGLLLKLQARGATLMGTESPELLVEEYQLATAAFALPLKSTANQLSPEIRIGNPPVSWWSEILVFDFDCEQDGVMQDGNKRKHQLVLGVGFQTPVAQFQGSVLTTRFLVNIESVHQGPAVAVYIVAAAVPARGARSIVNLGESQGEPLRAVGNWNSIRKMTPAIMAIEAGVFRSVHRNDPLILAPSREVPVCLPQAPPMS